MIRLVYKAPINQYFYVYQPPLPLNEIEANISKLELNIAGLTKGLAA